MYWSLCKLYNTLSMGRLQLLCNSQDKSKKGTRRGGLFHESRWECCIIPSDEANMWFKNCTEMAPGRIWIRWCTPRRNIGDILMRCDSPYSWQVLRCAKICSLTVGTDRPQKHLSSITKTHQGCCCCWKWFHNHDKYDASLLKTCLLSGPLCNAQFHDTSTLEFG